MQNIISKIKDQKTRVQITKICASLSALHKEKTKQEMDSIIQGLRLPLSIHLFITANYSTLMTYKYNNI